MYNETKYADNYINEIELLGQLQTLITARNKILEGEITIPESLRPIIDEYTLIVKCGEFSDDIRELLETMLDIEREYKKQPDIHEFKEFKAPDFTPNPLDDNRIKYRIK